LPAKVKHSTYLFLATQDSWKRAIYNTKIFVPFCTEIILQPHKQVAADGDWPEAMGTQRYAQEKEAEPQY
jgi:hypothetical protein